MSWELTSDCPKTPCARFDSQFLMKICRLKESMWVHRRLKATDFQRKWGSEIVCVRFSDSLTVISEEDFTNHVKDTIDKYGEKLESFDIVRFNKNIIDPVKMIFDKIVYQTSWDEIVGNEIFRQRDKSNNNDIGYFHQRIFQYITNCHVPDNGTEGGWDVIFQAPEGIVLPEGDVVHTVYVEMKNKHNTMNSASSGRTYIIVSAITYCAYYNCSPR